MPLTLTMPIINKKSLRTRAEECLKILTKFLMKYLEMFNGILEFLEKNPRGYHGNKNVFV